MTPSARAAPPLVEELIPCPDSWAVARKLAHLPHLLFLDSAERHPGRGRYSYVTADPVVWADDTLSGIPTDPFRDATRMTAGYTITRADGLPPFQGGLAGLFGYGLGQTIERIAPPRSNDLCPPELALGVYDWVVAFDHIAGRAWLVCTPFKEDILGGTEGTADRCDWVRHQLTGDEVRIEGVLPRHPDRTADPAVRSHVPGFSGVTSNFDRQGYIAAVGRAVEYIHAGDCFQVNISQRLLAPLREHPLALYGRLRAKNPAPFACYFDTGEAQIASASPERFLQVQPGGEVVTRPIKGTRPRGRTPAEDAALVRDLTTSPKDRAENVMIVDLLRNDLGRVCQFGSIRVPVVCEVETYRYVHHLVSEVRGRLRPGMTPFDLLRAAFPGGSVTGAPKVRAMEIIAELEPTARGPYCGSIGFVGFDGAMDTNILIRTFTAGRGWLQFPVGGGVVADSDPAAEYAETLHKAAGLLRALAP